MTNIQDDCSSSRDNSPSRAALLAVHFVRQVLDEAYVIANAAKDSGQPWRYISMLKNIKNSGISFADDDDESFDASKGDNVNENNTESIANIVTTSTPQKVEARQIECDDKILIFNDSTLIGQGDEDIQQNDSNNSTSMFINHLFDISEVERIIMCDDADIVQTTSESCELTEAMNKIMDSYVGNEYLHSIEDLPAVMSQNHLTDNLPVCVEHNENDAEEAVESLSTSDHSEYSFLADAFIVADIVRDVAFYIDDEGPTETNRIYETLQTATVEDISKDVEEKEKEAIKQNNDFALYEKAYMTLNRDYDQCSEDDIFPILQDPKEMILQEVELMTSNSTDEDLRCPKTSSSKTREEEATVSGTSGSGRGTLARRCRIQGARLFACLRGWWRRKTPGKRKESRRSVLAVCPLSPDARRRASSLLDNRSPSSTRPMVWKFNTVNEALVNSNCWKEYTFDAMGEESGD